MIVQVGRPHLGCNLSTDALSELAGGANSYTFRSSLQLYFNSSDVNNTLSSELYPCASRALNFNTTTISYNQMDIDVGCSVYDGTAINFTMIVKSGREIYPLHLSKVCPACPLDCHAPNGSCINGLCVCEPNFFGGVSYGGPF